MIMKIVLSEEKAKANNYSIEMCYQWLDNYFKEKEVNKIGEGIYQTDIYSNMAYAQVKLSRTTDWFLKVVETWHCNFVNNDLEMYMEDCLASYYRVKARNA